MAETPQQLKQKQQEKYQEYVKQVTPTHNLGLNMGKAFELAGYTKEHIEEKFPALFNAFQYGAPPHAGCAPGLDRIVMLLANENSIREVIAFPKNSKARDLLMGAPSPVFENQLNDVHIKLDIKDKEKEEKKEE